MYEAEAKGASADSVLDALVVPADDDVREIVLGVAAHLG